MFSKNMVYLAVFVFLAICGLFAAVIEGAESDCATIDDSVVDESLLPNEILSRVASELPRHDLCQFARTNKGMHDLHHNVFLAFHWKRFYAEPSKSTPFNNPFSAAVKSGNICAIEWTLKHLMQAKTMHVFETFFLSGLVEALKQDSSYLVDFALRMPTAVYIVISNIYRKAIAECKEAEIAFLDTYPGAMSLGFAGDIPVELQPFDNLVPSVQNICGLPIMPHRVKTLVKNLKVAWLPDCLSVSVFSKVLPFLNEQHFFTFYRYSARKNIKLLAPFLKHLGFEFLDTVKLEEQKFYQFNGTEALFLRSLVNGEPLQFEGVPNDGREIGCMFAYATKNMPLLKEILAHTPSASLMNLHTMAVVDDDFEVVQLCTRKPKKLYVRNYAPYLDNVKRIIANENIPMLRWYLEPIVRLELCNVDYSLQSIIMQALLTFDPRMLSLSVDLAKKLSNNTIALSNVMNKRRITMGNIIAFSTDNYWYMDPFEIIFSYLTPKNRVRVFTNFAEYALTNVSGWSLVNAINYLLDEGRVEDASELFRTSEPILNVHPMRVHLKERLLEDVISFGAGYAFPSLF